MPAGLATAATDRHRRLSVLSPARLRYESPGSKATSHIDSEWHHITMHFSSVVSVPAYGSHTECIRDKPYTSGSITELHSTEPVRRARSRCNVDGARRRAMYSLSLPRLPGRPDAQIANEWQQPPPIFPATRIDQRQQGMRIGSLNDAPRDARVDREHTARTTPCCGSRLAATAHLRPRHPYSLLPGSTSDSREYECGP